jgi:hypothetical protein
MNWIHVSDHDLERYYLGMVTCGEELAPLEEHILACGTCAERAEVTQDHVDAMRVAILRDLDEAVRGFDAGPDDNAAVTCYGNGSVKNSKTPRPVVALVQVAGEPQSDTKISETRQRSNIEALCETHALKVCNEFTFQNRTTPTLREIAMYKALVEAMKGPGVFGIVVDSLNQLYNPALASNYGALLDGVPGDKLIFSREGVVALAKFRCNI